MVADADGTNVVQLTPETLDASGWSFAPDGRSLLAVAVIDGEKRVLIRPVDPAAALTVLDIPLSDSSMEIRNRGVPASARRTPRRSSSWRSWNRAVRAGSTCTTLRRAGSGRSWSRPMTYVHDVAWSPTGEHISYDLTDETSDPRVVAADGSGDRALDNAPGTTRDDQVSPWSNDGTRIVVDRAGVGEADAVRTVVVSDQWRWGARRAGLRPWRRTSSAQRPGSGRRTTRCSSGPPHETIEHELSTGGPGHRPGDRAGLA